MLEKKIKKLLEAGTTKKGNILSQDQVNKMKQDSKVKELMSSHANMAKQTLEREEKTTVDYNYKRDPEAGKSNYERAVELIKRKQGGK